MDKEGEWLDYVRRFSSVLKQNSFGKTPRTSQINWMLQREELGMFLKTHAATFWGNKKIRKLCRIRGGSIFLTLCLGLQHVIETPYPTIPRGLFFPGKHGIRLWRSRWKVPSGYSYIPNGKKIHRQMEPKHIGWLLLEAGKGDTRRRDKGKQIAFMMLHLFSL